MRTSFSDSYRLKTSISLLMLRIREKGIILKRSYVAGQLGISERTIADLENRRRISDKLLLRIFHYYLFLGRVTSAEARWFFYLLRRLRPS